MVFAAAFASIIGACVAMACGGGDDDGVANFEPWAS